MKQEFRFKTNINCEKCVSRISPFLNKLEGIDNWNVDVSSPDKILIVETEDSSKEDIIKVVENAGFDIESIS